MARMTLQRALCAMVLVVGAAFAAVAAATPAAHATREARRASLATPLWSVRRYPEPVVRAVRDDVDHRRITPPLDSYVARFAQSCFVVANADGVVAAHAPDTPLLPASTEKILTATAALRVIGGDFRFTTTAVAPSAGGAVERLWVLGSGDPELATSTYSEPGVTTPLEALADSVVAHGVTRVVNGIVADDSRYDTQWYVPTWRDTYRTQFESGPIGALTVNHGIPLVAGKPVTVDDPGLYTASELARLLRARGVAVGPELARGRAPADATTVGSVQSQTLRTIVGAMLATSDNLVAEMLTKELAARSGSVGSTAAGTAVTVAELRELGVPLDGVTLADGSGLDRGNRVTCRALAAVADLARRGQIRDLGSLLPAAGQGTPVDGKVRAKGGYLEGVIGLTGFFDGGRPLQFAFLANGPLSRQPGNDLIGFAVALGTVPLASVDAVVPEVAAPVRTGFPSISQTRPR